jgi:hypothetical protein
MTETTMTETTMVTPQAAWRTHDASADPPGLTYVFRVLAVLEMFGGFVMAAVLAPGDPGYGKEWRAVAYVSAWTWLGAGFVFGFLFWAIGDVLHYLRDIARSLRPAASQPVEANRIQLPHPDVPAPPMPVNAEPVESESSSPSSDAVWVTVAVTVAVLLLVLAFAAGPLGLATAR